MDQPVDLKNRIEEFFERYKSPGLRVNQTHLSIRAGVSLHTVWRILNIDGYNPLPKNRRDILNAISKWETALESLKQN